MLVNAARLQARMDRDGLDGLIAVSTENIFYLTGVQPSYLSNTFAVITRNGPTTPAYVSSVGIIDQALDAFSGVTVAATYGKFYRSTTPETVYTEEEQYLRRWIDLPPAASALDALVAALEKLGLADKRIGVEPGGAIPGLVEQLGQRVKGKVQSGGDIFRWTRMVKTPEEVRRLIHSARITERAMIACKGVLREGVTEKEVAVEFERSVVSQGGAHKILHVRFGRNGVAGMAKETDTRLARGDTIWFDVGCVCEGYCSDLARVFSLGEPSAKMKKYYAAMLAGEEAAFARARPGMTAGELFDLTVRAVRAAGVPQYQRTHVGHAIGLEVYDSPLIAAGVATPLEVGMVITIETPYYEFGFGAAHAEDPFLMQADGNIVLTELSRDLHVVE